MTEPLAPLLPPGARAEHGAASQPAVVADRTRPPPRPVPQRNSRAYSGPCHGRVWVLSLQEPPGLVGLWWGEAWCHYRLARHPRTGRPVRDDLGSWVYLPEPSAVHRTARHTALAVFDLR